MDQGYIQMQYVDIQVIFTENHKHLNKQVKNIKMCNKCDHPLQKSTGVG